MSKSSSLRGWLILLLLIGSGLAAYQYWPQSEPAINNAVRRPVFGMLVLDNLEQQPEIDFLTNALTRETITKVGQLFSGQLDVMSYPSVVGYRGTHKTLHQIGRELEVDYLMQGGARRDRDQVHIKVQLIRVSDESELWVDSYDSPLQDVSQVQNQVINRIATSLRLKVNPSDLDALNRAGTTNSQAREAYLRGVDQCERSDVDLKGCIASFEKAIAADARYPRAHAALASAIIREKEDYDRAESHVQKALEVTGAIPQAHIVRAEILLNRGATAKEVEEEFQKAITLNQSDAIAHLRYAGFLLKSHRLDEAQFQIQRSLALEPFSVESNVLYGRILFAAKLYDQAIQQLGDTVALDRNSGEIRYYLGQAYFARSMYDDAIREFQRAVSFDADTPEYVAALGETYLAAQRVDDARAQLTKLKEMSRKGKVPPDLIQRLTERLQKIPS